VLETERGGTHHLPRALVEQPQSRVEQWSHDRESSEADGGACAVRDVPQEEIDCRAAHHGEADAHSVAASTEEEQAVPDGYSRDARRSTGAPATSDASQDDQQKQECQLMTEGRIPAHHAVLNRRDRPQTRGQKRHARAPGQRQDRAEEQRRVDAVERQGGGVIGERVDPSQGVRHEEDEVPNRVEVLRVGRQHELEQARGADLVEVNEVVLPEEGLERGGVHRKAEHGHASGQHSMGHVTERQRVARTQIRQRSRLPDAVRARERNVSVR
jgi:hypothetical protein